MVARFLQLAAWLSSVPAVASFYCCDGKKAYPFSACTFSHQTAAQARAVLVSETAELCKKYGRDWEVDTGVGMTALGGCCHRDTATDAEGRKNPKPKEKRDYNDHITGHQACKNRKTGKTWHSGIQKHVWKCATPDGTSNLFA